MKRLIFVFCFFAGLIAAHAQQTGINYTIKAGYGYSELSNQIFGNSGISAPVVAGSIAYGFNNGFSIVLEGNYQKHGYEYDHSSLEVHYIGIPLMLRLDFEGGFFGYMGLELMGLAQSSENIGLPIINGEYVSTQTELIDYGLALPIGIGYRISKSVFLDLRYTNGLTKISPNFDYTTNLFSLGFGYSFTL